MVCNSVLLKIKKQIRYVRLNYFKFKWIVFVFFSPNNYFDITWFNYLFYLLITWKLVIRWGIQSQYLGLFPSPVITNC